jgi:hypothetical protein
MEKAKRPKERLEPSAPDESSSVLETVIDYRLKGLSYGEISAVTGFKFEDSSRNRWKIVHLIRQRIKNLILLRSPARLTNADQQTRFELVVLMYVERGFPSDEIRKILKAGGLKGTDLQGLLTRFQYHAHDKASAQFLEESIQAGRQAILELEAQAQGGQGQLLPSKKKNTPDIRSAKAETTKPQSAAEAKREATRLRVAALRANTKGHSIRVTHAQNKKLKAIAAANDKNVQAYLEELVADDITANEHLVPVGLRKLAEGGAPKRVRTKRLARENARLRAELAKLKPA